MDGVKYSIAEWRRLKGFTMTKMAELCGVHINTYRYWEDKPSIIKMENAKMIADILNVGLDNIIFLP